MVDFSLRKGDTEKLLSKNPQEIINIDHHDGVRDLLEEIDKDHENYSFIFDNERSGASLVWKYFYPEEALPEIIQLVEYNDIGQWKKDPRAKLVALYLTPFVNKPEKIVDIFDIPIDDIIKQGEKVNDFADFLTDSYIEKTEPITLKIGKYNVIGYNVTYNVQRMRSMVGARLSEKHGESVALFRITGDDVNFGMRGSDETSPSALEIAKLLGGNGHRNSAGAQTTLTEFIKMLVL